MRRNSKFIITALVVFAVLILGSGTEAAFLLGLLVASALGVVDRRWSVVAGISCLCCCLLLLLYDKTTWLHQSLLVNYLTVRIFGTGIYTTSDSVNMFATLAYYFFIIGVTAHIFSLIKLRGKG